MFRVSDLCFHAQVGDFGFVSTYEELSFLHKNLWRQLLTRLFWAVDGCTLVPLVPANFWGGATARYLLLICHLLHSVILDGLCVSNHWHYTSRNRLWKDLDCQNQKSNRDKLMESTYVDANELFWGSAQHFSSISFAIFDEGSVCIPNCTKGVNDRSRKELIQWWLKQSPTRP